tara:strand:+ start:42 stop:329 length:288 start_codon:yes stop_codon:yes gene_type:complete
MASDKEGIKVEMSGLLWSATPEKDRISSDLETLTQLHLGNVGQERERLTVVFLLNDEGVLEGYDVSEIHGIKHRLGTSYMPLNQKRYSFEDIDKL